MAIKAAELEVVIGADVSTAQKAIGGFTDFLRTSAANAVGFFSAQVFGQGIQAVKQLASEGLGAVLSYERLSMTLEALSARELLATGAVKDMSEALQKAGGMSQELMKWIEDLALRSPYATNEVTAAFQDLVRYGFRTDAAKEMTDALLKMAAGSGMTAEAVRGASYALGQMRAAGKLNMQDLRQLINAGIDVNAVLNEMGYSLNDVGKETISSEAFIQKFAEVANRDFAGATDRMAGSLNGLIGALGDFKEIGLRELFGGAAEALKPLVQSIADWLLGTGRDKIRELGESLGNFVGKVMNIAAAFADAGAFSGEFAEAISGISERAADVWESISPFIHEGLNWIREHWSEIQAGLTAIAVAFGAFAVVSSVASLITALVNPLTLVIATIGLLAAAWQGNWGGIRDTLTSVWFGTILPTFEQVKSWLQTNIPVFLSNLQSIWQSVWGSIKNVIAAVLPIITSIWAAFRSAFAGDWYAFGSYLREAWDQAWALIKDAASNAWDKIREAFKALIDKVVQLFRDTDWGQVGRDIINGIVGGIKSAVGALANAAKDAANAATKAVRGFLKMKSPSKVFEDIGANMMVGWIRGIESMTPKLAMATVGQANLVRDVARQSIVNNYYQLYVTSNRSAENVIQDFWLMRSLAR